MGQICRRPYVNLKSIFIYSIIYLYIGSMVRSLYVQISDELWEKLIKRALKKYGHHGGIKKTVVEALEKLLREG